MNKSIIETLDDIIEEVKEDMCDHYCKWPNLWVEEIEGTTLEDGKCADCPLGRLSRGGSYEKAERQ